MPTFRNEHACCRFCIFFWLPKFSANELRMANSTRTNRIHRCVKNYNKLKSNEAVGMGQFLIPFIQPPFAQEFSEPISPSLIYVTSSLTDTENSHNFLQVGRLLRIMYLILSAKDTLLAKSLNTAQMCPE